MPADRTARPLTVSQLTESLRGELRRGFSSVFVTGELKELTEAASGHCYFALRDNDARLACVLWKSVAAGLKFRLEEGQQVDCRGSIEIYPPRGTYQLSVRSISPVGVGALELAFQQLRQRLEAEGLFARERKRSIPKVPRRVAVVTSPQGAAIRDFIEVVSRRWPAVELVILPVRVQGEGAAAEIAQAIRRANTVRPAFDVLVVCRGGGSLEDLWAFNEETVCRAVYRSRVPVVSGVGHETDLTLCDLTTDLRALTPSEAAERIVPDGGEIRRFLQTSGTRLAGGLLQKLRAAQQTVDLIASRPVLARPVERLERLRERMGDLALRLRRPIDRRIDAARHQAGELAARIETLSPLAVMRRGFTITSAPDGRVLRSVGEVAPGETIRTRLVDGAVNSVVQSVERPEDRN